MTDIDHPAITEVDLWRNALQQGLDAIDWTASWGDISMKLGTLRGIAAQTMTRLYELNRIPYSPIETSSTPYPRLTLDDI